MQNRTHQKKRFIAGAVCPNCHRMDTIALSRDADGKEYITCAKCDYYYDQADAAPMAKSTKPKQTGTTKPISWHRPKSS